MNISAKAIKWIGIGVILFVMAVAALQGLSLAYNIKSNAAATSAATAAAEAATASAKASKATQTLLTNGKTASAEAAKEGAKSAAQGEAIIEHVESQLDEILGHSNVTREIICSIAQAAHHLTPQVVTDCSTGALNTTAT